MSKYIRFTPELEAECRREFDLFLKDAKFQDGKITFSKTLTAPKENATVWFTPAAFAKMSMLLNTFNDEVAWHGVAKRCGDESKNEYVITDILVYPQKVTSATVDTDQEEYQTWMMSQEDDVFNNMRMQGHSHVNMAVSPSGTDLAHQQKIIDMLEDDMFYIFMIWNKRFEHYVRIYDMKKNILFQTEDVSIRMTNEGVSFDEFIAEAKRVVKRETLTQTIPYSYKGTVDGSRWNLSSGTKNTTKKQQEILSPEKREKITVVTLLQPPKKAAAQDDDDDLSAYYDDIYGQYCD